MRPDVKLGIFASMIVMVVMGGYYLYRDGREAPIPVDGISANDLVEHAKTSAKKSHGKAANTAKSVRPSRRPSNNTRQAVKPRRQPTSRRNVARTPIRQGQTGASSTSPVLQKQTQRSTSTTPRSRNSVVAQKKSSNKPVSTTAGPGQSKSANRKPSATRSMHRTNAALNKPSPRTAVASPSSAKPSARKPVPLVATPNTANRVAPETHRVLPGETLATISEMYYGHARSAKLLLKANPSVADPRSLRVGMLIKIPAQENELTNDHASQRTSTVAPAKKLMAKHYIVKSGDSLFMIAKHELGGGARWKEIFELNKHALGNNPNRLKVGQSLTMPAS